MSDHSDEHCNNPADQAEARRQEVRRAARRERAIERLGKNNPSCIRCGEDNPLCLELHHIAGQAYGDQGITRRRHVRPVAIRHIGKESNRWQERLYLGDEEGHEIDYGSSEREVQVALEELRAAIVARGQRVVSRRSGLSRRTIAKFLAGQKIREGLIATLKASFDT